MASAFDALWNASAGVILKTVFSDAVTLRRGSTNTTGVTAQKFLGERTIETGDGGVLKFSGASWVIAIADYAFSGTASTPRNGDRIVEASGEIWEVTPVEGIAEASQLPGGVEWVIMTKRVNG